jgi:hydrogenase maturation factor
MHDATEGGVIGGLLEVAIASGNGIRVDRDRIPVRPEVRAVCDHVGMDPFTAISEGTLIATVVPERAGAFVEALGGAGIDAAVVGEIRPPDEGRTVVTAGGDEPLTHPGLDPFWGAFGAWATEAAGGSGPGAGP